MMIMMYDFFLYTYLQNIYVLNSQCTYMNPTWRISFWVIIACYNCVNLHALGSSSPRRCDFENAFSSKTMQCRQCLCLNNMLFPAHRFSHSVFPKKFVFPINSSSSPPRGGLRTSFGLSRGCLHSSLVESGVEKPQQQNQGYLEDLKFTITDQ